MDEFTVISPVDHDGKHFAIGDPITLDARAAAQLLVVGSISAPSAAALLLSETLRGSDYLPTLIRITKDLTIPLTEMIERAFLASGLDRAGWNGLTDDDRELRIASSVELVRQQYVFTFDESTGVGRQVAAAEGARVMQDNQVADPQAAAAERVVVEHVAGDLATGTDAVQTGTAIAGTEIVGDPSGFPGPHDFERGTVAETADTDLVIDGTAEATAPAPAATTIVVDPVAATHTHTPTDGAPKRSRR